MIKIFFFVIFLGISLGGLLVTPKFRFLTQQFSFFILFFGFLCYIGMIIGMFLSSWMYVQVIEYILVVFSMIFIVGCITRSHPSLGVFYSGNQVLFLLISLVFIFAGIEWGLIGFRTLFTIVATMLFSITLFFGTLVQIRLRQFFWRSHYIAYFPLCWFIIIVIYKFFHII